MSIEMKDKHTFNWKYIQIFYVRNISHHHQLLSKSDQDIKRNLVDIETYQFRFIATLSIVRAIAETRQYILYVCHVKQIVEFGWFYFLILFA